MLVMINDGLVLNTDAIAAAMWDDHRSRWRVTIIGGNNNVMLTADEMDHILKEIATPEMVALLLSTKGTRNTTPGEHQ